MLVRSLVRSVIAAAAVMAVASTASAELVMVRVLNKDVAVRSRPSRVAETLAVQQPDSVLEVLSKEGAWFWVLIARDNHGTQRAGWIHESEVEFLNGAHYFLPPTPVKEDAEGAEDAEAQSAEAQSAEAQSAEVQSAEVQSAEASSSEARETEVAVEANKASGERRKKEKPVKVAKAEKPKKVDDRKLRKAQQELEKARQEYERLMPRAQSDESAFPMVGEPIVEPLYQISQN
jgi:hypothetical protein